MRNYQTHVYDVEIQGKTYNVDQNLIKLDFNVQTEVYGRI